MSKSVKLHHLHHTKHKNILLMLLSLVLVYLLIHAPGFTSVITSFANLGLFGAFITGILFVSTLTIPFCIVLLTALIPHVPLFQICIFAALGAVVGDLFIFHSVKDGLFDELKPVYKQLGGNHLTKLLHTRHFRWTLPVLGALIIASPLPDELGVTLLGLSRMATRRFMALSLILNAVGIFSLALTTKIFT